MGVVCQQLSGSVDCQLARLCINKIVNISLPTFLTRKMHLKIVFVLLLLMTIIDQVAPCIQRSFGSQEGFFNFFLDLWGKADDGSQVDRVDNNEKKNNNNNING